ncbi:hypothetical protein [Halanaerobaculum tunisiense]
MKLCDECITKLGNNLSQQAQQVLGQLAIILEDKGLTGMGFEQATEMNRAAVKDIIAELEDNLLLDHTIQDRRKVFYLTDSGQRFLELQQEPTDSEPEQEEETAAKEEEEAATSEAEVNNQGEQEDPSQNNTQEPSTEEENREEENSKEIEISEEELDNGVEQQEEGQQEQEKEQDSEPLVWDFDL